MNFYDAIVRWSVPIFVMISGALFLNADYSIQKICKKNILRIVTAFVFWSLIYTAVSIPKGSSLTEWIVQVMQGQYHMWFLYMIIGLYLLVPLLKAITVSKKLVQYFLIVTMLFTFLIPQLTMLLSLWQEEIGSIVNTIIGKMYFHFTLGYVGYFVLGFYLSKEDISRNARKLLYVSSLLGFVGTVVLTSWISLQKNQPIELFYDRFTINVLLESIGLFVVFKYQFAEGFKISPTAEKIIGTLSKYSFGAYLVHVLVMEQLDRLWEVNTASFPLLLSVPMLGMIIFIISFVISTVLNQIPILKKYIV